MAYPGVVLKGVRDERIEEKRELLRRGEHDGRYGQKRAL
jgi:hypothetical protein